MNNDQTTYTDVSLECVELLFLHGPTMLGRHLFTGRGLSPHSCGSLDAAMLYTQKAGASYMQYNKTSINKRTREVRVMCDAVLLLFISIVRSPGHPVILIPELSAP